MNEFCNIPYPLSKDDRVALDLIRKKDSTAVAGVLKSMADPARVKIIDALGQRELCVCVLVELTGMQYSKLSYHLKQLKDLDIVASDKDGKYLIYSLTKRGQKVRKLIQRLEDGQ